MREHLFISHANPEDNDFAKWLALRLIAEGYSVWCDLINLKGGEDFWEDIERGIREKTAKFLYVLSSNSNHKPGPNKELHVAEQTARTNAFKDFVIPLRIDQLSHSEFNIRVASLNAVEFHASWAAGLKQLLAKLRDDGVRTAIDDGPTAAASWWNRNSLGVEVLSSSGEECPSNWFKIVKLPQRIFFHQLRRNTPGPLTPDLSRMPFPTFSHGIHAVSFADRSALEPAFGPEVYLGDTSSVPLGDFLDGIGPWTQRRRRDATNIMSHLLTEAWTAEMSRKGLPPRSMANGRAVSYFPKGLVGPSDRVVVPTAGARPDLRQVVGYRTVYGNRRYWHVALQARPTLSPELLFSITTHVLFSDDGRSIWPDTGRLHAARRSQCKDWWNAEWRDRLLGSMSWLSAGNDAVEIPLGPTQRMAVSSRPLTFLSPVSYSEREALRAEETFEDDDDAEAELANA